MTVAPATNPEDSADPTLAVAEQQLAMLGRLAAMAMEVCEAFACSAKASAKAEERILADEYFVLEVGRARACGARDSAESFQKASRAVRLTMILEMNVAEILRDIRAGAVTYIGGIAHRKNAGEDAGAPAERPRPIGRSAGVLAGHHSENRDTDTRSRDSNTERLADIECLDRLPRAAFRETVERICADVGVAIDWSTWTVGRPAPAPRPEFERPAPEDRPAALSP